MIHPITGILHYTIAQLAKNHNPNSIIDIGGVGKLKSFVDCDVIDANKKKGHDGTRLRFEDNSFDVSVSVATLEHVENHQRFIDESIRVSRKSSIHWFPYGEFANKTEEFKKNFKTYNHPCKIPTNLHESNLTPFMTVSEHLLLLSTLYEEINCKETYEFIQRFGNREYGTIMVINK